MFKVLDPNTLNLDPDSEFWPYLDLDPVLCTHFEKDKNSFAKKNFLQKDIFFFILASEEILSQLKLSKGIFAKKKSFYKHL